MEVKYFDMEKGTYLVVRGYIFTWQPPPPLDRWETEVTVENYEK